MTLAHLPSGSDLRSMTARIRAIVDRMEGQFYTAGEALSNAYTRFGALAGEIEGLKALGDGGPVSRIVTTVQTFSTDLRDSLSGLAQTLEPLDALWSVSQDLKSQAASLFRLIRTMNIVALNARVNAVALSGDAAGLTAFTLDAKALVDEASATLKLVMNELAIIDEQSLKARELASMLSRRLLREATVSANDLLQRVTAFQRKLVDLQSSGGRLSQQAKAIADSVGSAVIALQSGDATRQRLEHIEAILRAVESTGIQRPGGSALMSLALRQLASAREHHVPSIDTALSTLDAAGRDVSNLMNELDRNFSRDLKGTDEIRFSIRALQSLIEGCVQMRERLRETATKLSGGFTVVHTLIKRIDALDDDMRLIGFNAVIACAGLGERALALKEVAKQLRELADGMIAPHSALKARLGDLEQIIEQSEEQMVSSAERLNSVVGVLTADLTEDVDQIGATLSGLFRVVGESHDRLAADVAIGVNALRTHHSAFSQLTDQLDNVQTPVITAGLDRETAATAARLRDGLTISSERDVHDAWLADIPDGGFHAPDEDSDEFGETIGDESQSTSDAFETEGDGGLKELSGAPGYASATETRPGDADDPGIRLHRDRDRSTEPVDSAA